MSVLFSAATGNFMTAGTWKKASAVGQVDSEASAFTLSNAQQSTNTFTPANTDVIDGVALKISSIISPTGTLTIELFNNTGASVAKTITINGSDLPANGWFVVKFSSTQTPNGTDAYKIRAVRSVADSGSDRIVFMASTASFADASRYIRITTTAAPATTDTLVMAGEVTGAGATNSFTLTMDRTNTTDSYGSAASQINISLCKYCTLTFGVAASTNYYFKWKGYFRIQDGGTLNVGTSGTRIPSTSTAVLEMGSAGNIDSGWELMSGHTLNMYGATKTTTRTYMTADKVATNTVIALTSTSGWAANDVLAFASSSRTYSENETKSVTSVDSGTQVTLSAGLTNAHSGTSPTKTEVGNLTRNIIVRGISTTVQGYLNFASTGGVVIDYVEFLNLGSNSSGKKGIDFLYSAGGTFSLTNCSIHDFIVTGSIGLNLVSSGTAPTVTITGNVLYNIQQTGINLASTGATVDNNFVIQGGQNGGASITGQCTFTNNTITSCQGDGLIVFRVTAAGSSVSDNTIHSCQNSGIRNLNNGGVCLNQVKIANSTIWRNLIAGIQLTSTGGFFFDTATLFGNSNLGITNDGQVRLVGGVADTRFLGFTINNDPTLTTTCAGFYFANGTINGSIFIDSTTVNTTSSVYNDNAQTGKICYRNCVGFDTNPVTMGGGFGGFAAAQRHGGTAGNHQTAFCSIAGSGALISLDASVFHTAAPSQKLVNGTGFQVDSAANNLGLGMLFNVDNGQTKTPTVWVRKVSGYTGSQPRLILKANPAIGVDRDTVLATMTAGTGTWEQLSGTTPAATDDGAFELVVDCDQGTINIDDWGG